MTTGTSHSLVYLYNDLQWRGDEHIDTSLTGTSNSLSSGYKMIIPVPYTRFHSNLFLLHNVHPCLVHMVHVSLITLTLFPHIYFNLLSGTQATSHIIDTNIGIKYIYYSRFLGLVTCLRMLKESLFWRNCKDLSFLSKTLFYSNGVDSSWDEIAKIWVS